MSCREQSKVASVGRVFKPKFEASYSALSSQTLPSDFPCKNVRAAPLKRSAVCRDMSLRNRRTIHKYCPMIISNRRVANCDVFFNWFGRYFRSLMFPCFSSLDCWTFLYKPNNCWVLPLMIEIFLEICHGFVTQRGSSSHWSNPTSNFSSVFSDAIFYTDFFKHFTTRFCLKV